MIIHRDKLQLSPAADAAVEKVQALQEYPVPATKNAIQRILAGLGLKDLTDVTSIIVGDEDIEDGSGQ